MHRCMYVVCLHLLLTLLMLFQWLQPYGGHPVPRLPQRGVHMNVQRMMAPGEENLEAQANAVRGGINDFMYGDEL